MTVNVAPVDVLPPSPTQEDCFVEVTLDCVAEDGRLCDEIAPPSSKSCTNGPVLELVAFSYQNCACDATANDQGDATSCTDFTEPVQSPVTIECVGIDGEEMSVSPATVLPGGTFSVVPPAGGILPDAIDCIISNDTDNIQQVVINTTGKVSLQLGDKFGALQLESCNDLTCKELLSYSIAIDNIGGVPMDVTVVDFTLNDITASFLDLLENPTIPVDATVAIAQKIVVDICQGEEYCASVHVEADPPNGEMCQADDEFKFAVVPLSTPGK